jgi:hypothetical protein
MEEKKKCYTSASESEEDASSSTNSEIIAQFKDKFQTSTKRNKHIYVNFTMGLGCEKNRKRV